VRSDRPRSERSGAVIRRSCAMHVEPTAGMTIPLVELANPRERRTPHVSCQTRRSWIGFGASIWRCLA
jgi:hypothetical protein